MSNIVKHGGAGDALAVVGTMAVVGVSALVATVVVGLGIITLVLASGAHLMHRAIRYTQDYTKFNYSPMKDRVEQQEQVRAWKKSIGNVTLNPTVIVHNANGDEIKYTHRG